MLRAMLVWLMLLCVPLAAQDTAAPPADEEVAAPEQAVAVEPVARDGAITRRIRDILDATGWYEALRVRTEDGVVFIDGRTDSDEHRRWARDLAAKTQDVVAVVNRVKVVDEVRWTFAPALDEIRAIGRQTLIALPLVILALIVLPLAWFAARGVSRGARWLMRERVSSPFLRDVLARLLALPVLLIGIYVVLQVAGLTRLAVSFLGGAGVLGIVIGFAFRDIAENFLASLLLSIRQPFAAGNYIDVGGLQGIVQSMNTRSTVLLSVEGNHIQIPNATIFKSTIINYSTAPTRRGLLSVGIGYDAAVDEAQSVIMDVLRAHRAVIDDPAPLVLVDTLGASTVNLKAYYWFDGQVYSSIKVQSALLRLIKKALVARGISMPDEAREVVFPEGVPVVGLPGEGAAPPAPRAPPPPCESEAAATDAEGDLGSEQEEIEAQAAVAHVPEADTDLLEPAAKTEKTGV